MKSRKNIIFVLILVVVFAVVVAVALFSGTLNRTDTITRVQNSSSTSPKTSTVYERVGTTTEQDSVKTPSQMPPLPTLNDAETSDTVYTKLRSKWAPIDFDGYALASTTNDWTVEYNHEFKSLMIGVIGQPGIDYQKKAEQVLLDALEMEDVDVCKLGIIVFWKNWDTQYEIVYKQLTFCQ